MSKSNPASAGGAKGPDKIELKVFKREVWSIDHVELTDEELKERCLKLNLPYDIMLRLYHAECSAVELALLSHYLPVTITEITEQEAIDDA